MKDLFHDSAPTTAAARYSPEAAIGPVPGRLRRRPQAPRYLWSEMLRIIGDIRPRWVIGENVAGILSGWYNPPHVATLESEPDLFGAGNELQTKCGQYTVHRICKDFEAIGYTIRPVVIPACAVGAPHRRDRVWFLASDAAADGEHWRAHDNPASAPASNATSEPRGRGAECEQQGVCGRRRSLAGYMNPAGVFCLKGRDTGTRPNFAGARRRPAAPINDSTKKP